MLYYTGIYTNLQEKASTVKMILDIACMLRLLKSRILGWKHEERNGACVIKVEEKLELIFFLRFVDKLLSRN